MPEAMHRNVLLLALCQALFMTGTSMVVTVTALAGEALVPGTGLGTAPMALQFIMTMATAVPASFVMRRFGRRAGFQLGAAAGILGGVINTAALIDGDFVLFCIGSGLIGVLNGFAIYYRFAAADCADPAHQSRAISLVLAGGVLAAFTGPHLARVTVDAIAASPFAGSFAAFAAIHVVTVGLMILVDIPRLGKEERKARGRPLRELLRLPPVIVAILAGIAGYSSMTLIMTATPLAMTAVGHAFGSTALVIQWHVFAMFAPAFFTGHLIRRFGVLPVIAAGAVLILACVAVNRSGQGVWEFTAALMALGIGWSFMFVGGTTLLSGVTERPEHAKMQGLNDFLVFGSVAAAALSAGLVQNAFGWGAVNVAVVPGVLVALTAALWLWLQRSARPA